MRGVRGPLILGKKTKSQKEENQPGQAKQNRSPSPSQGLDLSALNNYLARAS